MLTQHRELPPLEEMGSLKAIHLAHWGLLLPTDIARLGSLKDLRHLTLHSCAIDNSALGAIR